MLDENLKCISLDLAVTNVSNQGLRLLRKLNSLQELDLSRNAGISDEGIPSILALPKLNKLSIEGTKISIAGVRDLLDKDRWSGLNLAGIS